MKTQDCKWLALALLSAVGVTYFVNVLRADAPAERSDGETLTCDVAVVGGTPAGITAAIAAARGGMRVVLAERTAHVGGLPANGLGATDIHTRGATGGLFLDFVARVRKHYESNYGRDSKESRLCAGGYRFEPSVAEKLFQAMLDEQPSIRVLRRHQFDAAAANVRLENDTLRAVALVDRDTNRRVWVEARVFIDATYEGDLAAAAGVPFRIGREAAAEFHEPMAGKLYKLWQGDVGPGSTGEADATLQAYNYRLCLTKDPARRVPVAKPAAYNRADYASLVDDIVNDRAPVPPGYQHWEKEWSGIGRIVNMTYLPNGKTDANNQHAAFLSTDLPEENYRWPTADWAWRDRFAQRLRDYTLGLLWFVQNDPALPEAFRVRCREWGLARDEYADNGNFPRQVYVREARRIEGEYRFTAHDALPVQPGERPPLHADSITASHYGLDSHAVRKREPGRVHLDGFFSHPTMPYTVPYRVIVPKGVDGLLVPVAVSATHVGLSTLRMEPCWMAMGEAAGTAAALAVRSKVAPRRINVSALQDDLLRHGAVLVYFRDAGPANPNWAAIQKRALRGELPGWEALSAAANPITKNGDIGKMTNLADKHPDVVEKLTKLAVTMNDEIGGQKPKSRRPAGAVAKPQPLYPIDEAPKSKDPAKPAALEWDVVVYGGTPGGVAAAVAAAREGARTLVVEPTRHVGGLNTSGLCNDEVHHMQAWTVTGISREFYERLGKKYGRPPIAEVWSKPGKDNWESKYVMNVWESKVAQVVFDEMLKETNVPVRYGLRVTKAVKRGPRIERIQLSDGSSLAARVFIDCSYEGDLMARAGVKYTFGREGTNQYGESLAGIRVADKRFRAKTRDADGKLLPGISAVLADLTPGAADRKVLNYNFRLTLAKDPDKKVPFPKPRDYDPKRYALLANFLREHPATTFKGLVAYHAIAPGKYEANNQQGAIISLGHFGGQFDYPDADYPARDRIYQDHVDYTQGYFWFLLNDPAVPEALRRETAEWGLAKDEFADNKNWPYYLYIREGRRMIGRHVMTQKDVQTDCRKDDSVGLGSHFIDAHHVQRVAVSDDEFTNEGRIWVPGKPYEIPYRSLTPAADQCDNLLVPVAASFSHVAFCTYRLEPTWMTAGHAAGIAARLAVAENRPVADVPVAALQKRLDATGQLYRIADHQQK